MVLKLKRNIDFLILNVLQFRSAKLSLCLHVCTLNANYCRHIKLLEAKLNASQSIDANQIAPYIQR